MVKTFTVGIYHYLAFATFNQEVIIFKVSSAIWKFTIKAYSGPCQISKMRFFTKINNTVFSF